MIQSIDMAALLRDVTQLAEEAGARILEVYRSDFSIVSKDDTSPLTAADLAAHETICAGLAILAPQVPVLSEESATVLPSVRQSWACYWLVDPLDGTREFIKKNGEFTVNIALIDSGLPVLGVVHVPVSGVSYIGARGIGAFRISSAGNTAISVASSAHDPVRVVGSRSHSNPATDAYLNGLGTHTLIGIGSSLKFCMVAEGAADLYPRLGPTSEWDTAAAQCVVECAGGAVVDLTGQPLRYNQRESLLNPHFVVFGDRQRDWLSWVALDA